MAFPLTEIVATALRNRSQQFADNVSNGNALLAKLASSGKIKTLDGGRTIIQDLEYLENATFMYYSGYETLDTTPGSVFDAAEYAWKQAAVVVSASGLEVDVQVTGKEALIDLMEGRINNAMKTMRNNISVGIYSDGTGTSGKQITGLQAQVADAPLTGTVGGIDRATYPFWRNQVESAAGVTVANIEDLMRALWLKCTRGPDTPDLIVADSILFDAYWDSLAAVQRIQDTSKGTRGWNTLAFVDAEVMYDGGSGIPASHMYMLNTDYLYWRPHTNVNMVPLTEREPVDQHAFIVPVVFAGNLTMSNASLQGVIYDST